MKTFKNNCIHAFMAMLLAISLLNTSCKKNDKDVIDEPGQSSDYVGKWNSEVQASPENGDYKHILTLTKSGMDDIILMQTANSAWVNSFSVKGSLTVKGDTMNVHINEIGISAIDPVSGEFTGSITTYKEGSIYFEVLMAQMEREKDFQSLYTIVNNKLTLKTDLNKDGDYNDLNEITVYNRQ